MLRVNSHFRKQLTLDDIVCDFSGVRPLCDDESDSPQAITRDYTLSLDHKENQAPLLSVFGGKLTTYRKLAESAMQQLSPYFSLNKPWTKNTPLPGGENFSWPAMQSQLAANIPFVDADTRSRWIQPYGSRVNRLLSGVKTKQDLGIMFAPGIYQKN